MSGNLRSIDQTMSSASPWIAANVPGRCHGTAILQTQVAIGQQREKPVTIWHAKAMVERQRAISWKAIPSGQELTAGEIQNPDEKDDCVEDQGVPLLALSGLAERIHERKRPEH
jgi:hypothetical protein